VGFGAFLPKTLPRKGRRRAGASAAQRTPFFPPSAWRDEGTQKEFFMVNENPMQPGGNEQQPASWSSPTIPDASAIDNQPTRPDQAVVPQPGQSATATTVEDQPTRPQSVLLTEDQTTRPQATLPQNEETIRPQQGVGGTSIPVISIRDLRKTYILGKKTRVDALSGVSLDVYPGEFVAIMGPSGSGKSTFMNMLGCLDRPTTGQYWLAGKQVSKLSSDELASIRNRLIGFVFQGFNLLGRATAMSNVELPMVYAGLSKRERESRARKVLTLVGLGGRLYHKPPEMSGGQQQRVAVARALVNGPSLLLADEPTGNLDSKTSVEIMGVLQALNDQGLTIVLVTHDAKIAEYARRQVAFLDGRIVRDEPVQNRRSAQEEWAAIMEKDAVESQSRTQVKEETP
jgi:putative ABC transport system ATP-binding protein